MKKPKVIDELDDPHKMEFLRKRITELVVNSGLSENQISLELGKGKSYINGITSGRNLPSVEILFRICSYFGITEKEFFDPAKPPALPENICNVIKNMKQMDSSDVDVLLIMSNKLTKNKAKTDNLDL